MRRQDVAADHDPVGPRVGSKGSIHKGKLLVPVSAVPGCEEFNRVGKTDHRARGEDNLGHVLEMPQRDKLLKAKELASWHHESHNHGEATENGSSNKVGREDRGVPSGQLRNREVKTDDRMNAEHQWGRESSKQHICLLVATPLSSRPSPTKCSDTVHNLPRPRRRTVAQGGQVRNHSHVPKHHRNRCIGRHRKHIPEQGTTEIRPHRQVLAWIGCEPVNKPHTSDMNGWKNPSAHDSKNGHRFGKPIDTGSPMLSKQKENGGNQRTGMANADPKHKVHDRPRPEHRSVVAPDPHAFRNEIPDQAEEHQSQRRRNSEGHVPSHGRLWAFGNLADAFRNLPITMIRLR